MPELPEVETVRRGLARSLSDLKEIGCKNGGTVHFLPLSWAIERLLPGEIVKNWPFFRFDSSSPTGS
jgi:formamidopyrimidine-DNA glycosylase